MKFTRIRVRIFLLLAAVNVTLTLGVYLFNLWSFDRSLNRYLDEEITARARQVCEKLALVGESAGWATISGDPELVGRIVFETLSENGEGGPPGPPPDIRHLPFGFVLLDEQHHVLLGLPHPDGIELPVVIQGKTVAFLQIPPGRYLPRTVVHAFVEQQQQSFALIAIGMLLASVLAAWLLSHWLGTAIASLARGTRALIDGDCEVRLPDGSQDELGQLACDFNLLAQTLAANRRSRQEWIVNIAHELRTPLTVMLGEIEAVEDGVHAPDQAWQKRLGQRVRQLSVLVNDLHQLAESDQGALRCQKVPTDLALLARDWLESHRLSLDRAGLSLELDADVPVMALLDVARCRQLFGNLLQNSLRYTDAPGVLHVAVRMCDVGAQIIWEDSAPGVGDEDLARLTERLYRVETSRSRAKGGAGLGLSIVKAIIDAHGGELAIEHSPFGGVRLTLTLAKE